MRLAVLGAVLGVVVAPLLVLGSGAAVAHAFLDRAEPRVGNTVAAPREVALSFTQDLEPAFCTIEVTNAAGQRVDDGKPTVAGNMMRVPLRSLSAGTYRVKWHVLSVDTHVTEGAFTFQVRE